MRIILFYYLLIKILLSGINYLLTSHIIVIGLNILLFFYVYNYYSCIFIRKQRGHFLLKKDRRQVLVYTFYVSNKILL